MITAHATDTNSSSASSTNASVSYLSDNSTNPCLWGFNDVNGGNIGFGESMRHGMGHGRGPEGFMSGMNNIEVSSEYTANVNAILNNDTDIANLISEGYNVTSINPIIKNVIQGDGTITTQATTAIVTLQNGTSGYATANVDLSQSKVTQIVTITRTVIDK